MSGFLESFFDDTPSDSFNLWSKECSNIHIPSLKIIKQGALYKHSKAKNKWKLRHFIITDRYLLYLKSPQEMKVKGMVDLHFVRNEFLMDGHPTNPEYKYGIRFIRNMKYSDLWLKEEKDLREWQRELSKVCIQSDFHTKFTALKMIGKGSFARVYLIEDHTTGEKFAVKAFSKEYLLSQKKGKESLINEINIMKQLSHPNLMKLFEIHESQNSVYLILELLEGGELLDFISKNKGKITLGEYKHIITGILEALEYMSSKNIMHRDLKPENIILKNKGVAMEQNQLKIVDFGLATVADIAEYLFKRCGTPGFVAPEVVNASSEENIHYSTKCDVFSAGIIFHIMYSRVNIELQGRVLSQQNKDCKIDFESAELKNVPKPGRNK